MAKSIAKPNTQEAIARMNQLTDMGISGLENLIKGLENDFIMNSVFKEDYTYQFSRGLDSISSDLNDKSVKALWHEHKVSDYLPHSLNSYAKWLRDNKKKFAENIPSEVEAFLELAIASINDMKYLKTKSVKLNELRAMEKAKAEAEQRAELDAKGITVEVEAEVDNKLQAELDKQNIEIVENISKHIISMFTNGINNFVEKFNTDYEFRKMNSYHYSKDINGYNSWSRFINHRNNNEQATLVEGYQADLAVMALKIAKATAETFNIKMKQKVSTVIANKGLDTLKSVSVDRSTYSNGLNGVLIVEFNDGAKFTAQSQIVTVWAHRSVFNRYPTTFHNVFNSDGSKLKNASEHGMLTEFN